MSGGGSSVDQGRPQRIVLASANPAKATELAEILVGVGLGVELVPRPGIDEVPEVVEDAPDFVGNARLKAYALRDAMGEWALADDSGLEVDALDGAPGVISARYAGEPGDDAANVALLLERLEAAGAESPSQRTARFRCVIVLAGPAGEELIAEGVVEGRIIDRPTGDGGFGYDPVFVPNDGDGRTFALMSAGEKHAVSHRGRALRALAARLT
ncbi:MAG: RdgB/HAM1 family non-canonical purine NTP pyrophosphatase [Actinomycetota bacterium]